MAMACKGIRLDGYEQYRVDVMASKRKGYYYAMIVNDGGAGGKRSAPSLTRTRERVDEYLALADGVRWLVSFVNAQIVLEGTHETISCS